MARQRRKKAASDAIEGSPPNHLPAWLPRDKSDDKHDFEFQFGQHRSLKGRGVLGLLALAVVVAGFIWLPTNTARTVLSFTSWINNLHYDLLAPKQTVAR